MAIPRKFIRTAAGSDATYAEGLRLFDSGRVTDIQITQQTENGQPISKVSAAVQGDTRTCEPCLRVNHATEEITFSGCGCKPFGLHQGACKHMVALLLAVENRFFTGRGGTPSLSVTKREQVTDTAVLSLIQTYTGAAVRQLEAVGARRCMLEPTLQLSGSHLLLSLRLGYDRLYVVKDLPRFRRAFDGAETLEYGKNLTFCHDENAFDAQSKELLQFFFSFYREEVIPFKPTAEAKKYMRLTPYMADELLGLLCRWGRPVNVAVGGDKRQVQLVQKNPPLRLCLNRVTEQYFSVALEQPAFRLFSGQQHLYALGGDVLSISDTACHKAVSPLLQRLLGQEQFSVLQEDMPAFYASVVTAVAPYFMVDSNTDLQMYAPKPLKAKLYLDMPAPDYITAQLNFLYDETEYNAYAAWEAPGRDIRRETLVKHAVEKYFGGYDAAKQWRYTDSEAQLYALVTDGVDELNRCCEVYSTATFRSVQIKTPPAVSVGVKLASDLLNLTFQVEGFAPGELAEVLASYRQAKKYHRLKDGSFFNLENSALGELSALAQGLNLSPEALSAGDVSVPKYRALYLDNAVKSSGRIHFERDSLYKQIVRDMKDVPDSDFPVPGQLKPILRNYQKTGFRWLKTLAHYGFGGILADDMGLGKTLQVIALLLSSKQEVPAPSLVVCPSSLVLNWESELQKFAPELKVLTVIGAGLVRPEIIETAAEYDVIITSYDLLKRDVGYYKSLHFAYEIIDEAQYIKNQFTQNAQAVKQINAAHRFALTGTPVENSLAELWSIFDFLMPGYLFDYTTFKQNFEVPIVKENDAEALERLKNMVAPFMLRRLKSDVLKELPEKTETVLQTSMEAEQEKLYAATLAEMRAELLKNEAQNNKIVILSMLTRLRQICCDPSLLYENYHATSAKLQMCIELVESCMAAGRKMLLFSQFTSMLDIIKARLEEREIPYYLLQGSTKKEDRLQFVNAFNEDETPVFLISLRAGGTGLNLTGADVVVHYDPWWNLSVQNQATDRAHRIGQKNKVQVYKLITKGTIEEKILKLQEDKAKLADLVVQGGDSMIGRMSREELLELFS